MTNNITFEVLVRPDVVNVVRGEQHERRVRALQLEERHRQEQLIFADLSSE